MLLDLVSWLLGAVVYGLLIALGLSFVPGLRGWLRGLAARVLRRRGGRHV